MPRSFPRRPLRWRSLRSRAQGEDDPIGPGGSRRPFAMVAGLHCGRQGVYGDCMARLISTTVRLEEQDVRALQRARAAGHSASALIRKGLRVVASRYYTGRRPPSTRLFVSTDTKLGDDSELFRDLEV